MTKKDKTRSPLKESPLRNPGQSLDDEINRLAAEDAFPYIAAASFGISMAGYEWWRSYFSAPPQPAALTLVAIGIIALAAAKLVSFRRKIRLLSLGRNGERIVGQFLEGLRETGFQIFHDVPGRNFNVDHVVIGPQGIFSIETKTFSKPVRGDAKVTFDGDHILVQGWAPDRDAVVQARAQADWLRDLLLESTGRKALVRPVVVFPGWYVDGHPNGIKSDVWVLNPKALPAFIEHEKQVLEPEDVRLFSYHLSRYVRAQAE